MSERPKFCAQCGHPLGPADRFCEGCGEAAPSAPAAAPAPVVPPPPPPPLPPPLPPPPDAAHAGPAGRRRGRRIGVWILLGLLGLVVAYGLLDAFVFPGEYSLTAALMDEVPEWLGRRTPGGGATPTVTALAFSPDGLLVGAGTDGGAVWVWDVRSGRREWRFPVVNEPVEALAMSHGGRQIAAGSASGIAVAVWEPRLPVDSRTVGVSPLDSAAGARPKFLSYQPTDRILVGLDDASGAIRFWDTATGGQLQPIPWRPAGPVLSAGLSADHRFLAEGHQDGTVVVLDFLTRSRVAVLQAGPAGAVVAVAVGPEAARVAGAVAAPGAPARAIVWDTRTGALIGTLPAPADVASLAFSADGQLIAGGGRGFVQIWNTHSGQAVATFQVK